MNGISWNANIARSLERGLSLVSLPAKLIKYQSSRNRLKKQFWLLLRHTILYVLSSSKRWYLAIQSLKLRKGGWVDDILLTTGFYWIATCLVLSWEEFTAISTRQLFCYPSTVQWSFALCMLPPIVNHFVGRWINSRDLRYITVFCQGLIIE